MKVGIIGGSGLEDPDLLEHAEELKVGTPWGPPASTITTGTIDGVDVAILSRHGRNHEHSPTTVPNRANIWALQETDCTHILATTACGSLREEIDRGHFVAVDQMIDFTKHRRSSFHEDFSDGPVHAPMADPFDAELRAGLVGAARGLDIPIHERGTVITIEGPRFSTRAESEMFRAWGADVINMTTAPEVALANEVGIPYAAVAMSTDYDCWKTDEDPVSFEEIVRVMDQNAEAVKRLLLATIGAVAAGARESSGGT